MGYEDYENYTEVDPNSHITRTQRRVSFSGLTRPESAYVYKDKGAGHFSGDFDHKLDTRVTSSVVYSYAFIWVLALQTGDYEEAKGTPVNVFYVIFWQAGAADWRIEINGAYNGTAGTADYWNGAALNTTYYLRIKRTGSTYTCDIYGSAEDRDNEENALANLSVTLTGTTSFSHIYALASFTLAGTAYPISGYVENLYLGEAVAYKVTVAEVLGMVDGVSKKAAYKQAVAEKLGMVDAAQRSKGMYVAVAEKLGLKDAVAKKAAYKQLAAEKLGMLDAVKKAKGIHITAAEKLGLVDDYFKRLTAGRLPDNPDNVGSRGSPVYKDMPDYMGAVYVNTKNTWQDAENLDELHGYTSYMWIPEEMFSVKIMKLHVYAEMFRAYSKTTETVLPSHRHDVKIDTATSTVETPSHTHTVSGQTAESSGAHAHGFDRVDWERKTGTTEGHTHIYWDQYTIEIFTSGAHTHSVSGVTSGSGAGSHSHTVDYKTKTSEEGGKAHKHEIDFGIWKDEEIAGRTLSAILYDPKGNPLEEWDPLTTGEMDIILDLTEYFKDLKYGMYRLELKASGRIRARLVYYELGIMFAV